MTKNFLLCNFDNSKATICLFFLATTFCIAHSTRILDEVDPQLPQVISNVPGATNPQLGPGATTLPSGQIPVTTVPTTTGPTNAAINDSDEVPLPNTQAPAAVTPAADDILPPPAVNPDLPQPQAEVPVPAEETPAVGGPVASAANPGAANPAAKEPTLSFFMHDILGGSHPSARVVAGIVASTDVTGLPFSKFNNNLFPLVGGIPLVNPKLNGIITNNNLPLLVGLNAAQASTVFQNRGTSNIVSGADNQPFVSAGNLPAGLTIQKLMFGTVTVIDDQLTDAHDLDSTVVGRAQGFYLASSLDGTSQTIVLTILLHSGEHGVDHTISFFGVHRTASPASEIAVIGGTGKYDNARGYAALETLPKVDQHTTDGVDTIMHFSVYLTE